MTQRYVLILAVLLTLAGLSLFVYKWRVLGFPLYENQETSVWTIESAISFDSGPGSIKVNLHIPTLTPGFRTLNENSESRGYGFNLNYGSGGREAQWAIRRADGRQTIYYRISVFEDPGSEQADTTPPFPPPPAINEPFRTAVDVIVSEVREHSADTASFTTELLKRLNDPSPDPNVELLMSEVQSDADFVDVATMMLAVARIPARMVRGFELSGRQRSADLEPWLEIHDGDRWRFFNPTTGEENLPEHFFIWWRGNEQLVNVEGGSNLEVDFAIQEAHLNAVAIAKSQSAKAGATVFDFSLYSLPIQTQAVYSVLLMIPIGAFVMVVMRNLVGIDSFGTFMPVLIALAFRETELLWGIVLFGMLLLIGMAMRAALDHLKLLLVSRLAVMLTIVVLAMAGISVLSHRLGLERGLSVALFPMVIIAMTIERMSIVWEERGASEALQQAVGSLMVAALAYLIMSISYVEHLVFIFPELLLVLLAGILCIGRYTGYRISELIRFKNFSEA